MTVVFKSLIHIFAFTFVVSFMGMVYLVQDDKTDNMGLRQNDADSVQMLEFFISHHPAYYGLKNFDKLTEIMGVQQNVTDGLMKLAAIQKKNQN